MKRINYMKKGEWLEVDVEVEEQLPLSTKRWNLLRSAGGVKLQGAKLRPRLFPEEPFGFRPEWDELEIVYEDDFILAVLKRAGIPVHPVERSEGGSLANQVAAYYETTGQQVAVRQVNRLDADTSGIVLYGKNPWAQSTLDEAMRGRQIKRIYKAIVSGCPQQLKGTINAPIGKDRHHPNRRRISSTGVEAITHYEVIERWEHANAALLSVALETGRTHQIRVHLQSINHPLYGDRLYGGPAVAGLEGQALHGGLLEFHHPWHGQSLLLETPMPHEMEALVQSLRKI